MLNFPAVPRQQEQKLHPNLEAVRYLRVQCLLLEAVPRNDKTRLGVAAAKGAWQRKAHQCYKKICPYTYTSPT